MSRTRIPADLRERVAARGRYRCGYCLTAEAIVGTPMEMDHIIPEADGGPTDESNLWPACSLCNAHKGPNIAGIDPVSRKLTKLYNPRHHKCSKYFQWDGGLLVGLTAVGRVTILVLAMNAPEAVEVREALIDEGGFPPTDS
jgi:hypothetical protein